MLTAERRNKNILKSSVEWDLNVYCPEQWNGIETTWDTDLWKINARIYTIAGDEAITDTHYTITLLEKEARALGLIEFGQSAFEDGNVILDDWLDAGLDCFITLPLFKELYWDKCNDRIKEYLDDLPKYWEDIPKYMII